MDASRFGVVDEAEFEVAAAFGAAVLVDVDAVVDVHGGVVGRRGAASAGEFDDAVAEFRLVTVGNLVVDAHCCYRSGAVMVERLYGGSSCDWRLRLRLAMSVATLSAVSRSVSVACGARAFGFPASVDAFNCD